MRLMLSNLDSPRVAPPSRWGTTRLCRRSTSVCLAAAVTKHKIIFLGTPEVRQWWRRYPPMAECLAAWAHSGMGALPEHGQQQQPYMALRDGTSMARAWGRSNHACCHRVLYVAMVPADRRWPKPPCWDVRNVHVWPCICRYMAAAP